MLTQTIFNILQPIYNFETWGWALPTLDTAVIAYHAFSQYKMKLKIVTGLTFYSKIHVFGANLSIA